MKRANVLAELNGHATDVAAATTLVGLLTDYELDHLLGVSGGWKMDQITKAIVGSEPIMLVWRHEEVNAFRELYFFTTGATNLVKVNFLPLFGADQTGFVYLDVPTSAKAIESWFDLFFDREK
jgi:hypothetical protein